MTEKEKTVENVVKTETLIVSVIVALVIGFTGGIIYSTFTQDTGPKSDYEIFIVLKLKNQLIARFQPGFL